MTKGSLNSESQRVILSIGDIIIDRMMNQVGILVERTRRIDMIMDDVYMWEVKWLTTLTNVVEVPHANYLEEETLKLWIVLGTYDWHSVDGGTFEL
jgi:hypothetical protein|tara:strand:- start:123 stop:410 length:288 start_codon:yes stop_codon:yes gene_type:complete